MAAKSADMIIRLREDIGQLRKDHRRTMSLLRKHKSRMKTMAMDIGKSLAIGFGIASVISGVTSAVNSLVNFEQQMAKVRAISRATGPEFEKLRASALSLARDSKFTAQEIGELQLQLSKLGFSPERIMATTKAISDLALVTDSELGEAGSVLAATLNSFNLDGSESAEVANIMAEAFSKSALDLEKFAVATSNSGALANAFGITLEENTARLGALVDAGIDASKAGTDLRRIYIELNQRGLTYNEAMRKINQSTDKGATAFDLFKARAQGAGLILAAQETKVNRLTKELSDNTKEMEVQAEVIEDTLRTSWKKFTSALDSLLQKGSAVNKVLKSMTDAAARLVNTFNEDARVDVLFNGLKDGKKTVSELTTQLERLNNLNLKLIESSAKTEEQFSAKKARSASIMLEVKAVEEAISKYNEWIATQDEAARQVAAASGQIQIFRDRVSGLREQLDSGTLSTEEHAKALSDLEISQAAIDIITVKTRKLATEEDRAAKNAQLIKDEIGKLKNEDALSLKSAEAAALKSELWQVSKQIVKTKNDLRKSIMTSFLQGDGVDRADFGITADDIINPDEVLKNLEKVDTDFSALSKRIINTWEATGEIFKSVAADAIVASLNEVGTALGNAIAGNAAWGEMFDNIYLIMANGLRSIGEAMIALGISLAAMKEGLKSVNPYVIIAAGAALVVAGAALHSALSASANSIGSGGSGGSGGSRRGFSENRADQSIQLEITGQSRFDGRDLVMAYDTQVARDRRNK